MKINGAGRETPGEGNGPICLSVFEGAERLAKRAGKSRSRLFSDALEEYVARHASDEVTAAMNRVCSEIDEPADGFLSSATHHTFAQVEL